MSTAPSLFRSVASRSDPTPLCVVDKLRHEFRSPRRFRAANSAIPVEDGRSRRIRIDVGVEMGEPPLACDKIRNTIAVDVGVSRAVDLRESNSARIFRGQVIHHHVFDERYLSASGSLLFKPGKPPSVGIERGDNVIETVTIDVEDGHYRPTEDAPAITRKGLRVKFPFSGVNTGRGLLRTIRKH